ncbi:unnamed protein product [Linum tenue]|uniref:SnoaL-like domain-containing protein n=1 Tax=Linum tenue TaxID=586396 RepID=A0AAV0MG60_9ROSI|nr:unnamed protein product [Linum tenue]
MSAIVNLSSVLPHKGTFPFASFKGWSSPPRASRSSDKPWIVANQGRSTIVNSHISRRQAEKKRLLLVITTKTRTTKCLSVDDVDITSAGSDPISPYVVVNSLYEYINAKKLKELGDLISVDCTLEDCSFPFPIQGKKEAMIFFQQLTSSMGQNVKFRIDRVCDNSHELTAAINWHLEWNKTPIPFTRGCSFYECTMGQGSSLVIKKALVVIESPIKPGGIVLALLRNVTALFDEFPTAAEWFLQSPHVIIRFLMRMYSTFMAPVINPLMAGYFKMWTLIARFFTLGIQLLLYISNKYFGKD